MCGLKLLIVLSCKSFNVCRICSDFPLSLLMLVICAFTLLFQFYSMFVNCIDLYKEAAFSYVDILVFFPPFCHLLLLLPISGLPCWLSGWRVCLQCRRHRRHGFDPWARKIPWRRERQPTSVFLPGKFLGQKSLVGYSPWGHKESDTTEQIAHWHYLSYFLFSTYFNFNLLFLPLV